MTFTTDGIYSLSATSLGMDVTLIIGEINSEYCEEVLFCVFCQINMTLVKVKRLENIYKQNKKYKFTWLNT